MRGRAGSQGQFLGPEALDAAPFLDLLAEYGSPHRIEGRAPADPLRG